MYLTRHANQQIAAKGFDPRTVAKVAVHPDIAYESHRYPGQWKHIGDGLCVVVKGEAVITVFEHMTRTALRADQLVGEGAR